MSRSRCTPSPPTSLKPALITTAAFTPFLPQSSSVWFTNFAGTTMTARSTASGTSAIVGYARTLCTTADFGFTG
jgi:hypothetical protein